MKKVHASISLAAVAMGAIALAFAATGPASPGITSGELFRELSEAARAVGAGSVSQRLTGIAQEKGSSSALTEGAAAAMLQKAGYAATTSNPDRLLTRERATALVHQFRAWAVGAVSKTESTTAKGSLPDDIDTCFDESNHGQCVACCKDMGGSASTCSKACMVINKPSASEPLP